MATYDRATLRKIYDRTSGKCHICRKKLAFTNYGQFGERGSWEVEHSNCRANGGADHGNNYFAACISCNRSKGANSTRSARAVHGYKRAPYSVIKRKAVKTENTLLGGGIGAGIGAVIGGPLGALIGGGVGAYLGNSAKLDH